MTTVTGAAAERVVTVPEPLDAASARALLDALERDGGGPVRLSLERVRSVETLGLAALAAGVRRLRADGRQARLTDMDPAVARRAALLKLDEVLAARPPAPAPRALGEAALARVARALDGVVSLLALLHDGVRHSIADGLSTALGREQVARQLDQAGARATALVGWVSLLVGAILAMHTAYEVAPYGGAPYVARVVTVSMVRELGPLMTALILAGRSGSAIAAELGSMVVNEEVDALEMMGLRPRRFLVSPRFLALCLATPALSTLAGVCGVLGGGVVMSLAYEVSWGSYYDNAVLAVPVRDLGLGLLKAAVFGALIAAVACRRGLSIAGGPEAVGRAATAAVVDGILALLIFDTAFTIATRGAR